MGQFKQYFTPEEANQRLPLVRRIVRDIMDTGAALKAVLAATEDDTAKMPSSEVRIREDLMRCIAELEMLGCFYQGADFKTGLVDFPSWRNGEEVFLCWQYDEPDIRWYHSLSAGFAGRQPLFPESAECTDAPAR